MKPAAFLTSTAVAAFAFFLQPGTAQVVQARYEVLPVRSDVYHQTVNVFVYTHQAAPAGVESLPVIYVPLLHPMDSTGLLRLEQMMQEGAFPFMRIVGIERSGRVVPAPAAEPALYANPKKAEAVSPTDDEWFCRFLDSEVVPAVQGKYKCSDFKALYIDESTPLGSYMFAHRTGGFNAYLSPTPFVWFNGEHHPAPAKTFLAYYSGVQARLALLAAEQKEDLPEEFFLKTGKLVWGKQ